MAIELIKEAFKVEELKGSNEIQALVETEIYLSTSKPNIEKILWVQGKVEILNTKIIKDKLIISGLTRFNLLYKSVDEENSIQTLDATKEFREELDILGVSDDMISKVKSKIEYIEWDLEPTKVLLKALVNIWGNVVEFRTIEAIKEIQGKETLQALKEKVHYKEVYSREISYASIKDVIRIKEGYPEIDEIVKFSVKTKEVESMVVEDRIITSGEAIVNLIYYGQNKIYSHKETFPFNHFIEMSGVDKDFQSELEYEVIEGSYEIVGNELGERKVVDIEINIRVTGKAFKEKSRELIIDAYSTRDEILLEREGINIKESLKDIKHTEEFKLDINYVDADEILEIDGYPSILDIKFLDDDIVIEGILSLDIQYIDKTSQELSNYKGDFPFKTTLYEEETGEVLLGINTSVDTIDFTLKNDGFSIETDILLDINLSKNRKIYSIKQIVETEKSIDKNNKPSIIIYIVQRGDKLWDIAKRYNTTIEEILTSNNNTTGELNLGDKIIIEKMVEGVLVS